MLLKIEGISFGYNSGITVIKDLNMKLDSNNIISVVGKSGCGKTTIFNLISQLLAPQKGSVYLQDIILNKPTNKISYLSQTPTFLPFRTAFENTCLSLELRGELDTQSKKYIKKLFEKFNLKNAETKYPFELSGGMRQRIGIIQSISVNSLVYLLDEPFTAIDRRNTEIIEDVFWEMKTEENSSFVIITHDLERAVSISDKVIILDSNPGQVFQELIFDKEFTDVIPSKRNQHPKHSQYLFELVKLFGEL